MTETKPEILSLFSTIDIPPEGVRVEFDPRREYYLTLTYTHLIPYTAAALAETAVRVDPGASCAQPCSAAQPANGERAAAHLTDYGPAPNPKRGAFPIVEPYGVDRTSDRLCK